MKYRCIWKFLLADTAHSHTLRKVEEVVLMVLLLEDTAAP